MIVEVHDHKASANETKKESNTSADGNRTPFSIHDYNVYITPSPYVPYPQKPAAKSGTQNETGPDSKTDKDAGKENMQAPGQPASSQKAPAKPKITTVVLFPTEQQKLVDLQLLATTPAADYRRTQAAGRTGHPATPLSAVPPTPTFPTGRSPKRQKMVVDETNVHEVESEMLRQICPKLYLEPTKNLMESQALIDAITHPNNKNPAPARKSRKRTTAELAADEAEAADMERYMLAGDEGQANKTAATAGGEDGQSAVRGANFNFARLKALESIKMAHEENERRKKDEHAMEAQAKRQLAAEQEAKKRKEQQQEASRQAEQAQVLQRRQELLQQQQLQQQIQQDQAMRAVNQAQQMAGAATVQQTPQSSQPQYSSPVPQQRTPMPAAGSPLVQAQASHPMGGTPMVATSSNHGAAGSPARPPSVVSNHAAVMARSVSQQQNQPMSRTGTPQMVQGTPVMNSVGPARNMAATPQPRMNQGSPTGPMQVGTPVMMQTPQMHIPQGMTPDQIQQLQQNSQMARLRQMQQQGAQMSPAQSMQMQHMQQQMQQHAMAKAQHYIRQHGVPPGQDPTQYHSQVVAKFFRDLQNERRQQMNNMSPQTPGNMTGHQTGMPTAQGGMGMNIPAAANIQQQRASLQNLKQRFTNMKQTLLNNYGGQMQNVPQQHQQQLQGLQNIILQKEAETRQMMQNGAIGGAPNPATQQFLLQQQRANQARQQQQQQMLQMQQRQQGMNPNQMPQNMMNNMGMMSGLNGMNMQNMGGGLGMMNPNQVPQNMMNMQGMQGMQGMNMQNMGGNPNMGQQMNQQQQMRMLMQQAQMRNQVQQGPQGEAPMDWSGGV